MDAVTLRAWWAHRQGLDGSMWGLPPAEVLARAGWARSVGGVGPYLGLRARCGASREEVDAAQAGLALHELPAARGCTYVVPARDFALALQLAARSAGAEMRVARQVGVTDAEVDGLCRAVLDALGSGPLAPDELRAATGGAARSLGPEGRKKGLTTTLPLALGRLQVEGEVRRVPTNGRLDQQRYRYALWRPGPRAGRRLPEPEADVQLARLYLSWIGPASLAELRAFASLGAGAARAAVAPLGLQPLGDGSDRLLLPADREALEAFRPPEEPGWAVVSSLDGITLLRRNLGDLLDAADASREVMGEQGTRALGALSDLPSHAILERGRLAGLWEYDPDTASVAWLAFGPATAALERAVAEVEAFVRDSLGDARTFSLDTPASRAPRIAALRWARAGG